MHLVEGPENGFDNIPKSVYWAIVTMTTVGYGDIAPQTVLGQALAAGVMILGYAIIIVPIGVFSAEIVAARAESSFIRASEHDSQDLIHDSPLFAYLAPGRFAAIDRSNAFPFPAEMKK